MVEEKFKVTLDVEVDQRSLAQIKKDLEKQVKAAFESATTNTGRGGRAAVPLAPGAARSAREAVGVGGRDLARIIKEASQKEQAFGKQVEESSKRIEAAVTRLIRALEAQRQRGPATGPGALEATRKLIEQAVGPSNRNLARDIVKSRTEAGRASGGSGSISERRDNLQTGTPRRDLPRAQQTAKRRESAREAGHVTTLQRGAAAESRRVSESLNKLAAALQKTFRGKVSLKDLGLPTKAEVGPGASVIFKDMAGQTRVVTKEISILDGKLRSLTNAVSATIERLTEGGRMGQVERMAQFRPERALGMLKGDIRQMLQSLPVMDPGRVSLGFQKGGEAKVTFVPNKEQRERLSKLKDERDILVEVNKMLYEMVPALKELKAAGIGFISSIGIAEATAAGAMIPKGKALAEGAPITATMQTRNLAALGLGGAGAVKQTRMVQPQQVLQTIGGKPPAVMGRGERSLLEAGMMSQKMGRELFTAVADIPEVMEDQIVVLRKAAEKFQTVESKAITLKSIAGDIEDGMEIMNQQLLGFDPEGREIRFDQKGIKAKVKSIQKVLEEGLEGFRVEVEEVKPLVTGSKVTTRGGFKGIVKLVDSLGKFGQFGEEVEAVISRRGALKRQDIRDPMEMMANKIASEAKVSAQAVADKIHSGMDEAGLEFNTAVKQAAESFGIGDFTGTVAAKGGMLGRGAGPGGRAVLGGGLHFGVLPGEGAKGPADIQERFFSRTDMASLRVLGEQGKLVEVLTSQMQELSSANEELITTIRTLVGETDVASENLREILPEELKRLPGGAAAPEKLKGTLLDPDLGKALAMRIPKRGGGEELLRVPGIGKGLGQRGFFKTALGGVGAGDVARQFDRIAEASTQLRASLGQVDLAKHEDSLREAAIATDREMNRIIETILEMGVESQRGRQAFEGFVSFFKPMIDQLQGAHGIQFRAGGAVRAAPGATAGEYVAGQRSPKNIMLAIRDVMGRRPEAGANVGRLGALFQPENVDMLTKSMQRLNVSMAQDEEQVEKLYQRLERLKEGLMNMFAGTVFGRAGGGGAPGGRRLMEQMGAGVSVSPYAKALSVPAEVAPSIEELRKNLERLGEAGYNVTEALSNVRELEAIQPDEVIPKDAIIINQKDFKRWAGTLAQKAGISPELAAQRLQERPVVTHRFPTTGPASFLPRRLRVGDVPEGKVGVAGPFAEPPGGITKALGPILSRANELREVIRQARGFGEEAAAARAELAQLDSVVEGLRPTFLSTQQNLDFDGDALTLHTDVVSDSTEAMNTFTERVQKGAMDFWAVMSNVINKLSGEFKGGGLDELAQDFKSIAKGRPEGMRRMGLMPQTAETMGLETFTHISPKMKVGLATDAYNKFMMAVVGGSEDVDEAFSTGLQTLMLNINEALKQKHVAGTGQLPALQLLQDIGKGNLQDVFKQMEPGGTFGKLGDINKQFREQLRGRLEGLDPTELGRIIGEEVTPDNWDAAINQIVERSDLKATISRMFDILKNNMANVLRMEGVQDIEGAMQKMLGPKGKGLDLNKIVGFMFPQYFATRGMFGRELEKLPPVEKLKDALAMLPKDIMKQITSELEVGEAEFGPGGVPEIAGNIAQSLKDYLKQVRSQFETIGQTEMSKMGGGRGVHKEGQIFLSREKVVGPLVDAMNELRKVSTGELQATPAIVNKTVAAIQTFTGVLAHEGMHKALKSFSLPVFNFIRRLQAQSGPIAAASNQIIEALEKLPNIRRAKGMLEQMRGAAARGDPFTEIEGRRIRTRPEDVERAQKRFERVRAEEALAYTTDPKSFAKVFEGVPQEALEAIRREAEAVKRRSPEIVQAAMNSGERITGSLVEGLLAALEGEGGNIGRIRSQVAERINQLMGGAGPAADFPGRERLEMSQMRLGAGERALAMGRKTFGLGAMGFDPQGLMQATGELRQLPGPDEIVRPLMDLLEAFREGTIFGDPEAARGAEGRLRKEASSYMKRLQEMEKRGDIEGGAPFKEYQNILREFQASKAQFLINEARKLNTLIEEMKVTGGTGTNEFRDTVAQFEKRVNELQDFFTETIQPRGRGKGLTTSIVAGGGGQIMAPALEMGVRPTKAMFGGAIQEVAGRGVGEAERFKPVAAALTEIIQKIEAGSTATKEWRYMFDLLAQRPETFKENMGKLKEVFSRFAKLMVGMHGQSSAASQAFEELSKFAAHFATTMQGLDVSTLEDITAVTQKTAKTMRIGRAGDIDFTGSMKDQFEQAQALARDHAKKLTQYMQETGETSFEPLKFQIIDPKTGQVIQKISAEFSKSGKQIVAAMNQGGAAVNRFGRRLRDAFRRVVQWGFATGIIYGTMRAFRSLTMVITDVQDRIVNLQKVMDVTITNFEDMQDAAVGMAKNFGIAINDVLDGMVVYGQQGLRMNEILERTRATMLAVNVTTLSSTEATEALTAAHKIFADEVDNSLGFVDAWGAVAAKHAITAKDLALAVQRSGAAAGTAGLDFNDFLGIVTSIGAVTRQTGKEVATATKFMFRAMRRPTAQKELAALGIPSQTAGGDLRPAMDVLQDLAGAWEGMSRAQQLSTAQAMAGIRHYNAFIILMKNFKEALEASDDAANSQGFAMRKNSLAMQAASKQMQVLRESLKQFGLEVGKAVLKPATSIIKGLTKLVEVAGLIPAPLLMIGTAGAAGMLALHRGMDIVLDSMDAMMGHEAMRGTRAAVQKKGIFGLAGRGFEAIGKAGKKGLDATSRAAEVGLVTTSLQGLLKGLQAVKKGFQALNLVTKASIVGLVASLGALAVAWYTTADSGQEVEDAMFDQIGRSQDAARAFDSHRSKVEKVSHAYTKYQAVLKKMEDPEKFAEALGSGSFQGAVTAAQEYTDILADVGQAMAQLDPSQIIDISETGDYIIDVSQGFAEVAASAKDAQNAITASMQVKVIKAYADEITKTTGVWDRFIEMVSGKDKSPAAQFKKATDEVKGLLKQQRDLAKIGISNAAIEERIADAMERRLELGEQLTQSAVGLKKVLEEMPAMEDLGLAAKTLGPGMFKALGAAAPTGVFGRGATAESIMFKQLSKSAGVGGVVDYRTAGSPGLMAESMVRRGIMPQRGLGGIGEKGGIATVSAELAQALVAGFHEGIDMSSMKDTMAASQQLIADVDSELFYFVDGISGTFRSVSKDALQEIAADLGGEAANIITFSRKEIEDAAEKTRRVLTLQFTGALAGIRETGAQMGPSRRAELSAEQRVMEALPEEMQRLADVQKELASVAQNYNEQFTAGDLEAGAKQLTQNAKNIKVLEKATLDLVLNLQKEGFDLSVLAHYNRALHQLNMTLEQSAAAARDAAIEEQTRYESIVETSGAMAGLPKLPQIDFGKTMKELTAQERLQRRSPAFREAIREVGGLEKNQEIAVQRLVDIRKQMAQFDDAMRDLGEAGTRLEAEQAAKRAEDVLKGIPAETRALMTELTQTSLAEQDIMSTQLGVQESMLEQLEIISEAQAYEDPKARAEFIQKRRGEKTLTKMAGGLGKDYLDRMMTSLTGISATAPEERGRMQKLGLQLGIGGVHKQAFKPFDFADEATQTKYNEIVESLIKVKDDIFKMHLAVTSGGGTGQHPVYLKNLEEASKKEQGLQSQLLSIPQVAAKAESFLTNVQQRLQAEEKLNDASKQNAQVEDKLATLKTLRAQELRRTIEGFSSAEAATAAEIEAANQSLMYIKDQARLSTVAENLAKTIEDVVNDFKKAEALHIEKIKSDLTGPFARVGKPGFKTDFERRREEIQQQMRGGPKTSAERKDLQKQLADVEFDEKEARLKMQQDEEIAALRQQQQQAERLRSTLYDAWSSGQLAGTGMEQMVRNYIDTLGEELARSEQATMRGGELRFEGVPSLQEAMQLATRARQEAETKAAQSRAEAMKAAIADPVVNAIATQTSQLQSTLESISQQEKSEYGQMDKFEHATMQREDKQLYRSVMPTKFGLGGGKGALNLTSYVAQMAAGRKKTSPPQVGLTNNNLQRQLDAEVYTGRADALPGSVVSTEQGVAGDSLATRQLNQGGGGAAAQEQSEILISIQTTLDGIATELVALRDEGVGVPEALTNSIDAVGTTISDALGDTLEVNITNTPIETTVNNLSEITDAFDTAGLAGVGAEITDAQLRLNVIESAIETGGTIDARIEEATSDLPDLQSEIDQTNVRIDEIDEQIDGFENQISDSETRIENALTQVEDFSTNITDLQTESDETRAIAVEASETAQSAQNDVTSLESTLESRAQTIEAGLRTIQTNQDTITTIQQLQEQRLITLESRAQSANSKAERALTNSLAARRI